MAKRLFILLEIYFQEHEKEKFQKIKTISGLTSIYFIFQFFEP